MDQFMKDAKVWTDRNRELQLLYEHVESIKEQTSVMKEQIYQQNIGLKKSMIFNWIALSINTLLLVLNVIIAFLSL